MLTIEADIYEYVRMSYVDKNILGPLVHMYMYRSCKHKGYKLPFTARYTHAGSLILYMTNVFTTQRGKLSSKPIPYHHKARVALMNLVMHTVAN